MSQYVEGPLKTDTAAGALGAHLRVKTPGALAIAGDEGSLGTMEFACFAAGPATYRMRSAQGSALMVASGIIGNGVAVYAAASGKIAASGTHFEGYALEAAGADGDIIEVMRGGAVNLASAITGTTGATFTVASGSAAAKLKLDPDSKTGDYTLTLAPTDNLGGNIKLEMPVSDGVLLSSTTPVNVTTASANALAIGRLGATTPAFHVDASTGTSITGVKVKSAAASGGVAISAIGETNVNMTIDAAGTGTITLGGTSTGAITLTRAVTLGVSAGGAGSTFVPLAPIAAQQDLSGAGAADITNYYTAWTTGGAEALTLADGAVIGQLKKIQMVHDGGDGTLTPSNLAGGTNITFADAGDFAILMWNGTNWVPIELGNAADGATAPVLA